MKRLCYRIALAICFLWITITPALAAAYLIPGGQVVGLQLQKCLKSIDPHAFR